MAKNPKELNNHLKSMYKTLWNHGDEKLPTSIGDPKKISEPSNTMFNDSECKVFGRPIFWAKEWFIEALGG